MSVRRRVNWLNQLRVDVPDLKSIESAVSNDFDELLKAFILGEDKSYIIRGFEFNMSGAIGGAASGLEVVVEDSAILHGRSTQSGTFFAVPSGTDNEVLNATTNEKVDGAFTPSSLNYVGLEFTRGVDDTTTGQRFLWNPTSKTENTKDLPLAVTFDYKFVITSSIFASNILPIAIVETDSSNNVVEVSDARELLFRLATAGSNTPDPFHEYGWDNHSEGREENFYKSSTSVSPFRGGDKQILSFKENDDALKTEIKLLKGTKYWYSGNPAGSIYKLRADLAHTQITGAGKISHSSSVAGQMNWDSDIYLDFVGSRLSYKILSNELSTDIVLGDNQVAYIKLVRGVDITPKLVFTQGSSIVSSVGAVSWTGDVLSGDWVKIKTEDDTKYYQINTVDSASQVTLTENYLEDSTGSAGTEAQYAIGSYSTDPAPSTDRHVKVADRKDVAFEADTYWMFLRSDKGSSVAKVYMRGASGGEIEQGESRQISDNTTAEILEYVGSPAETDTTPDFTNSIANYVAEIQKFAFGPASGMTSGQSLNINSASNVREYYVWFNIAGAGGDPYVPGRIGIEVVLTGTENAVQVGTAFYSAVDAIGDFNATDNGDGSVDVENSAVGESDNATNNDVVGLTITSIQEGVGKANCAVIDDENLTKSIKRLDETVCDILEAISEEIYREELDVISGVASNSYEIQGPVSIGTLITLPLNSHDSNIQPQYEVGSDVLEVFVNGHLQRVGFDYNEVGSAGDLSTQIEILIPLDIGYNLEFRFKEGGAGGSGGGTSASGVNLGPASTADVFKQTVGSQLQFRRLTASTGVQITEGPDDISFSVVPSVAPKSVVNIIADYSVQSTDDVVLVTNGGSDVTVTLPSATSSGREITIKKLDNTNTMFIKTIGGQLLDGSDADASPLGIVIQNESITVISDGTAWYII